MNNGIETDVIALDLSKAFDTVPHRKLLCYQMQRVIVDGQKSEFVNVISGVPQLSRALSWAHTIPCLYE